MKKLNHHRLATLLQDSIELFINKKVSPKEFVDDVDLIMRVAKSKSFDMPNWDRVEDLCDKLWMEEYEDFGSA